MCVGSSCTGRTHAETPVVLPLRLHTRHRAGMATQSAEELMRMLEEERALKRSRARQRSLSDEYEGMVRVLLTRTLSPKP